MHKSAWIVKMGTSYMTSHYLPCESSNSYQSRVNRLAGPNKRFILNFPFKRVKLKYFLQNDYHCMSVSYYGESSNWADY